MFETRIIPVFSGRMEEEIAEATEVLRNGGLVAFPTETVYGLGADAFNPDAVTKVFEAKGRPSDNPLIVHISDINQLHDIARAVPDHARKLAEAFWPGPLTLVVEHRGHIPSVVTAGLTTVAVRMPNHPTALALIKTLGRGVVGPSANLSGMPSPTTAQHVYNDLRGKVEIILDAGPTLIGVESTVVDVTVDPPTILRLGGLPRDRIERIVGEVQKTSSIEKMKRSPGTRYRHYAPVARVELLNEGNQQQFLERVKHYGKRGKSVGCIVHSLTSPDVGTLNIYKISKEEYAVRLFNLLRGFDEVGIDVILVERIPEVGIGEAVMDRLRKAAETS